MNVIMRNEHCVDNFRVITVAVVTASKELYEQLGVRTTRSKRRPPHKGAFPPKKSVTQVRLACAKGTDESAPPPPPAAMAVAEVAAAEEVAAEMMAAATAPPPTVQTGRSGNWVAPSNLYFLPLTLPLAILRCARWLPFRLLLQRRPRSSPWWRSHRPSQRGKRERGEELRFWLAAAEFSVDGAACWGRSGEGGASGPRWARRLSCTLRLVPGRERRAGRTGALAAEVSQSVLHAPVAVDPVGGRGTRRVRYTPSPSPAAVAAAATASTV